LSQLKQNFAKVKLEEAKKNSKLHSEGKWLRGNALIIY
jgi:hypothetical protein